ncbi:ABC transporter substrate-binding protein [Ilumatobacter sp.]|uniref:ABC transporter substrate-binding protein n=1 Tax=Ilumatobacter sp. TaxID=1967498 RepID=UPI003B52A241
MTDITDPNDWGRRRFLRTGLGGAALLGIGPAVLAACGSDGESGSESSPTTPGTTGSTEAGSETSAAAGTAGADAEFGDVSIQLSWFKNAEFAGDYIAEQQGYFAEQGFASSDLVVGGPDVDTLALILSDRALITYTGSEIVAGAILNNDAPIKIIGCNYQTNPFCILSLADGNPIRSAEDMRGKTVGVQAANDAVWQALLEITGIEEGTGGDQVNRVPAGFDPSPLDTGEMDGFFSFATNEPWVQLARGEEPVVLLLADLGFNLYQQLYVVTDDALENRRDEVVAAMAAITKGWQHAISDIDLGIEYTLEIYGADLDLIPESQENESKLQAQFIEGGSEFETEGIFHMSEEDIETNLETLELLGLAIDRSYYTNEIMDEVYADGIVLYEGYEPGVSETYELPSF